MKKTVLFLMALMCTLSITAQPFNQFERDFVNGDNADDFTFIDQDGDGNSFSIKQQSYECSASSLGCENSPILSAYGRAYPGWNTANIKDWLILPAQDLSYGVTNTKLVFSYLTGMLSAAESTTINVYVTTSDEINDIITTQPITSVTLPTEQFNLPSTIETVTVDIPGQYNVENMSLGILFDGDIVYNITEFAITSIALQTEFDETNGTATINNTKTFTLKQNPVQDKLSFTWLNGQVPIETKVSIYSVTGALIQTSTYTEEGIDISSLQNGIYMAKVITPESTDTIKFIKK